MAGGGDRQRRGLRVEGRAAAPGETAELREPAEPGAARRRPEGSPSPRRARSLARPFFFFFLSSPLSSKCAVFILFCKINK